MQKKLTPEEKEFLEVLHDTFIEMREKKKITVSKLAAESDSEKSNICRDEKRKANGYIINFRRKCDACGFKMSNIFRRAENKWEKKQREKQQQPRP